MRSEKAYTMNEILIVIIVISVLISIALPRYASTVERMRSAEGVQTLTALLQAEKMYFVDNNTYTSDISTLDVEIPTSNLFSAPEILEADNDNLLVSVRRNDPANAYYLEIDENGVMTCRGDSCLQLGY